VPSSSSTSSSTPSSSGKSRAERPDAALSLYHLLDPEVLADPYPLFERLRREDPVHWDPFLHAWIVTRYSDVLEVLHTFSADRTPTPEQLSSMGLEQLNPIAQVMVQQMLFMDAPAHTRLRSLASKAFTPARVEKLRGHIREIVDRLLDAVESNGHMDVIAEFAEPLPAIVTAELLGVPVEDWRKLKTWSSNFAEMLGNFQHNPERNPLMLRTVEDMTSYFRDAVRETAAHPREGLIDSLITAEIDGDRLTEEEVIANSIVTMVGGLETTTNLIGNGLLSLLRNPGEYDRLNQSLLKNDDSLIPSAVEEMLRYESPSQHTARLAPSDRELGGKKIEKRQAVIAVMAAANRDPERFPDPDRFDITRADNRHLAFGYAAHFCFGAPLARAEGQIAFERMLSRLRNIQLEPQKLVWRTNLGLRGLTSLKIRFNGGSSGGGGNSNDGGKHAVETLPAAPLPMASGNGSAPVRNAASRSSDLEKYLNDRAPQQHVARRSVSGPAPLSFPQQQIWLHSQIAPEVPVYNEPVTIYRDGPLDFSVLEKSFAEILRRHEAWRTTFDVVNGEPVQIVNPVPNLNLPLVDLRHLPDSERNEAALHAATKDARRPFNLKECPLLRAQVVRLADEEYRIYITLHHLIFDGLSIYQVFLPELAQLYAAFSRGEASPLADPPIQYSDFAGWQRNYLRDGVLAQHLDYWRTKLAGDLPVLDLPTDYPRPAVQTFQGAIQTLHLSSELGRQLKALSKKENSTLFITLLAAFETLLHRYSGQDDLLIGTVAGSRKRSDFENLLGCFQNPIVLRTDFSGSPSFSQVLTRVRETTLGALQHDEVPFELVVKELHIERDLSRNPLVQVAFTLVPQVASPQPGWSAGQWDVETGAAKFDLYLEMEEDDDGLTARFMYRSDLFLPETIERLKANFTTLLQGIVAHPEESVGSLPLITDGERQRLLVEWNDTKFEYPNDLLLHYLIRMTAVQTPSAVALTCGDQTLSYRELETRSNQLAHQLLRAGVAQETVVALYFERSIEIVVAILAVLKAGGTCLPLDPAYPAERLAFMLTDSGAPLALTHSRLEPQLSSYRVPIICVDKLKYVSEKEGLSAPAQSANSDSVAYLIYTSGSTGQPKGVRVTHRGLVNSTLARKTYYREPLTSFLLLSSFTFDSSLAGVFWTLSAGATLVLPPDQSRWDLNYLPSIVAQHKVSHLLCVPSLYQMLLETAGVEDLSSLQVAIVAGESCPGALVEQHHARVSHAALYNEYGPTEATVWCSVYKCEPQLNANRVPIGRPIANTQLYVLDARMQPVPIGVSGELHVGGTGVTAGYWKRPDLTAQKFVADPFTRNSKPLYKTGDKVRYRSDGNLEWLGRMDGQIKLRGFRLELGEIEAALAGSSEVFRSVVQVCETSSGMQLVAYVVPRPTAEISPEILREYLATRLPAHAIPAAFVTLEAIPELPNGKVDTRRLPAPDAAMPGKAASVAPRSPVEEVIAGIWAQVLQREDIGVREDFFALGGHSLLAAKVVSRILQTLGVELPLRAIFERPTVEGLSALIESSRLARSGAFTQAIARVSRDSNPPLSFAQQRLWFLDQLEPGNALYNVPCAIQLTGRLNEEALERSINEIIRRHEILRTRFTTSNGQPVQVIAPSLSIPLPVTDLGKLPQAERKAKAERLAAEEAKRSFNLGAGPLLRANLLRLAPEEHVLLLNIHHIASDETSREIIVRELVALYDAFSQNKPSPLPELKTQYADYAVWQRGWLKNGSLEKEIAYWRKRLQGAPAVLELPTDHSRPAAQSFRGANLSFDLDSAISESLKALSQREGATLFMTLLAAFQVLLARYTGQDDIVVGSPFTNRQRAEVEGLIGFFVNTVPLRVDLSQDPSFRQLLHRVKETALEAYDHRELPLEKLVEELRPERNLSYNPLFQVLFAVQNSVSGVERVAGLTLHLRDVDTGTAKFDLTCTVIPKDDGGFTTGFEYNTDLFEAASIRRMIDSFHSILEAIARDSEQSISQLPLLSQKERHKVLVEWNATQSDYPRDKCIHQLVEAQAAATPDAPAVVHDHDWLTYRELNQRANQLAHFLRKCGVGPEVPVGVCLENSLELTIALLAVLKAGGACLALDPAYPKERLQLMLEDSGAPVLLSREGLLPDLASAHTERLCILAAGEFLQEESCENPEPNVTPKSLAYMIYTSGSTGKPKGVMLTHGGLVNYITAAIRLYGLRPSDRLLQFSSISFDIAIEEIFPTWAAGATLVLRSGNFSLAGSDFLRWARQQKLTVLSVATAYWHELVHELAESGATLPESLRLVIVGGEKAQIQALEAWRKVAGSRVRWLNTYGPTETCVIATSYEPPQSGPLPSPLPIGRPIDNVRVHILDRNLQLVPVGIPGEVHIGGPGVARGYLHHPDLTEAKFIADPFSSEPGARLYKTGDLAHYLDDGQIEFVGRRDFQVKIRGFRVELGEIEAALAKHPAVRECIVIAREEASNIKRLVGYVVPAAGATTDAAALRKFLKKQLPEYMVPTDFVLLQEFPLTPNGKVDRNALPAPLPGVVSESGHVAATNFVEAQLVAMWEEILAKKPVGIRDNFFDLGGHSLLAVRLMRRIEQNFKRKLPLTTLFEAPTIEQFAALLQQGERWTPSQSSLVPIQPEGDRPPFFCIHGLGGTVLRFHALAQHMGTDRPFYGVQAQGLEGDRAFHNKVEDMAAFYIKEIRTRQPEGPYYLGGYSLGGLIAFEMSRQLQADGQEVGLLALLDTYPGKPKSNKLLLSTLLTLPRSEQISYLMQRAKRIRKGVKRRFEALFLPAPLKAVRKVFAVAEEGYKPQVYFGSATWFRATEKGLRGVDNPTDDWSKWVTGGVEVHDIEGDHGSILKEPQVRHLAESVRSCLNKAQVEHAERELETQAS
jgi:surfactin family lipopeptide synthetase A